MCKQNKHHDTCLSFSHELFSEHPSGEPSLTASDVAAPLTDHILGVLGFVPISAFGTCLQPACWRVKPT